ncbi:uncharacterized protein B0H18DRAFT_593515 [Fomitopsis serialis]|uniref:uncharacterized protein n=1 Tax=Fomitopsis serialis TaxID=139415 RepID=UPI0020074D1E|nr:uncharacterized protein B0H18DRAFT_593515 [Neoantrodia serialis]KAH9920458.1 hypothetical protein B0H18DRAFT_593515 [Neoantrodia serialis]
MNGGPTTIHEMVRIGRGRGESVSDKACWPRRAVAVARSPVASYPPLAGAASSSLDHDLMDSSAPSAQPPSHLHLLLMAPTAWHILGNMPIMRSAPSGLSYRHPAAVVHFETVHAVSKRLCRRTLERPGYHRSKHSIRQSGVQRRPCSISLQGRGRRGGAPVRQVLQHSQVLNTFPCPTLNDHRVPPIGPSTVEASRTAATRLSCYGTLARKLYYGS